MRCNSQRKKNVFIEAGAEVAGVGVLKWQQEGVTYYV